MFVGHASSYDPVPHRALLWEYVMGQAWTQLATSSGYLSDSSVEVVEEHRPQPVPVYKARLGPNDDSSEEEREEPEESDREMSAPRKVRKSQPPQA